MKSAITAVVALAATLMSGSVRADETFTSDGFSCSVTDAGIVKDLRWKGKKLTDAFVVITGDAKLDQKDKTLSFSQEKAAAGRAKITKDANALVAVTEFPVKGASGQEYFKLTVTAKVTPGEVSVDTKMTRTIPFKFDKMVYCGNADWPVAMFAGALCDFVSWDDKHTYKKYSEAFTKANNDAPTGTKLTVSGKSGDWQMTVAGGYFGNVADMRAWGGDAFRTQFVQQRSVSWGGLRNMEESGQVTFTLRPGEKVDPNAAEKQKAAEKAAAAKAAAEEAKRLLPIVKDFPSREQMWSLADAGHDKNACRERYSLNGLWGMVIDNDGSRIDRAPAAAEVANFLKVPGKWPTPGQRSQNGLAIYNDKGVDVADALLKPMKELNGVWYVRTVDVPAGWADRKTILGFRWLPTAVLVYVDGQKAGDVFFPGGELDLSSKLTPGKHEIAVFMTAKLPEKLVAVFDAPDQARTITKKAISQRGINGDVYLAAEPKALKIDDVQVRSHVKDGKIDFSLGFVGAGSVQATAVADVYDGAKKVKSFKSGAFTAKAGERFVFGGAWADAKTWDVDTPENVYTVRVSLLANGKAVDESYPEEFGFREVTVSGRDLLLNGKPIHLRPEYSRMVHDSAVSNGDAEGSFRKMREYGFNFEIDGAYGFAAGDLSDFEFSIRGASKVGMPSVMGLPHPCHYAPPDKPLDWHLEGAYENLVRYEVKMLQNIPGLILWSSTHNETGYEADQNPEIMTGRDEDVPSGIVGWRKRFRQNSKAVNKLLAEVDPGRPIYHHESGQNGEFYTLNCYLDWAPIQERSDWLETWQEKGVMPLFIVEWGAPHIASWASYRGEDRGRNIWSSWNTCKWCWLNEFNAAYLGEEAFHLNPQGQRSKELIAWHCTGNKACYYGAWDGVMANDPDLKKVTSMFMRRNIRDMRYRGITMILPWDIETTHFTWPKDSRGKQVREDALKGIKEFGAIKSDYSTGYHNIGGQIPTLTGETLVACYADILGWIGGPGKEFTTVNDTYRAGETVEKSLLLVNDTRHDRTIAYRWSAGAEKGKGDIVVKAGRTAQVPVKFTAANGMAKIEAEFSCAAAKWTYKDAFALNILPKTQTLNNSLTQTPVSLFDPEGTAKPLLAAIGVKATDVTDAPKSGVLVIGRNAYAKLPFDLKAVAAAGVKVVMLEQDSASLKKLGFRFQEHALREAFANDSAFAGLDLTSWRGVSTMLPWFIGIDKMSGDFPRTKWEGFDVTRVWRCGNRCTVASVLPEKPARGDYRALVSGGFNLQYAPLMEYTAAKQRVVFSQFDLCGRLDRREGAAIVAPEAAEMLAKILDYANRPFASAPAKTLVLEGGSDVATTFGELGIPFAKANAAADAKPGDLLVIGPNAKAGDVSALVASGVNVLALGLTGDEVNAAYPAAKATNRRHETFPDYNAAIGKEPLFSGVSNADIQWSYASCMAGLAKFGDADVLAAFHSGKGAFVANGVAPWRFDTKELALRHNRRRAQALVTRLVANLGGAAADAFPGSGAALYADKPMAVDDPYRYFRW